MQLLVLQGENIPVSTFTKQQHLTDSGLIAFAVRERMVYIKCTGGHLYTLITHRNLSKRPENCLGQFIH